MISNLLGYNIAADGTSEEDIRIKCRVIEDAELNTCIYKAHNGVDKNRTWGKPIDRNDTFNDVIVYKKSWTIDYGPAPTMQFPSELNDPYVGPSPEARDANYGIVPSKEWFPFETFTF